MDYVTDEINNANIAIIFLLLSTIVVVGPLYNLIGRQTIACIPTNQPTECLVLAQASKWYGISVWFLLLLQLPCLSVAKYVV